MTHSAPTTIPEITPATEARPGRAPLGDNGAALRPTPEGGASPMGAAPTPRFGTWRYRVCTTILAAAAIGMVALGQLFAGIFHKDAVPLLKPIPEMNASHLQPEFELHPVPAEPLDDESLENLGTRDYLMWRLVDPSKKRDDPTAVAHVFITYYTGKPDMVPHVPDECYHAAGSKMLHAKNTTVVVGGVRATENQLPVRATVWKMPPPLRGGFAFGDIERTVLYFFHCNGDYMLGRTDVRLAQANPTVRYAYYAKVEVNFTDYGFRKNAGLDESLEAMPKLLGKVMRVLLTEHFPDWTELNAKADEKSAAAK